jgi:MYXO-CTERM domain-containing protein
VKRTFLVISLTILTAQVQGYAYQVRTTTTGKALRWADGPLPVLVALTDAPDGVSGDDANAAALRAFDTYASLVQSMTPEVAVDVAMNDGAPPPPEASDGKNVIRWVKEGWDDEYDPSALAVTLMSYDTTSGRITDADIVVNGEKYPWIATESLDGCSNQYDLQNVLTHELGHLFGLAHDPGDDDSTMFPSSASCEDKKRDLDENDVEGLTYLYVDVVAPVMPKGLGCSVGGGDAAGGLGTVLVAGLLIALVRRRTGLALAGLALVGLATPATATTVRRLSLDAMSGGAQVVVRGIVSAPTVHRVGARVYTDHTLEVSECWKGTCGGTVTVRQLGGEIDGVGTAVEGTAQLMPGTEVVLLLRRRADGAFTPVGMAQGAYRVERDADQNVTLVRDGRQLRFAKPTGGAVAGTIERITVDDLKKAIARSIQ